MPPGATSAHPGLSPAAIHRGTATRVYTDCKLRFPVTTETPNPVSAHALQQSIRGVEGEIRVAMQSMVQASAMPGTSTSREMLYGRGAHALVVAAGGARPEVRLAIVGFPGA